MYLIDYHTHSILSMDGKVPLSVMGEYAAAAGISELCLTDHCDLLDLHANRVYGYDWTPALKQFHQTAPQFEGRLKFKLGLEYGMGHIDPAVSEVILNQPELDFVIGSIHNLSPEQGGADLFYGDYSSPEICSATLDDYFSSMEKLAATSYYDVLGHIIYPLRYMNGMTTIHPYLDRVSDIMKIVLTQGKGIEVNTYRGKSINEWTPVLERYKALGGELITVGSDAHDPVHAGAGIQAAYELLKSMGFRYVATYDKRKSTMIPI